VDDSTHIRPGAFGDKPKTLPLVVYDKDGNRHVVGEATITPEEDGLKMDANVTDPVMKELFQENIFGLGAISNPKFEKEKKDGR
jgi:hypothetical protein